MMPTKSMLAAISAAALTAAAPAATKDLGWATVEYPDVWGGGSRPVQVKVTLAKDIAPGQQVCTHLHWMKRDGWGGMLSWVPGREAKPGSVQVFNHRPQMKDGLNSINLLVFLASGGDFAKKTKDATFGIPYEKGAGPKPDYPDKPDSVTYKKSYIWLEEAPKPTRAGEDLVLKVHYKLDPSDTWGPKPSQLLCMPLGPWIDNPDGVVNKNRHHVGYPGLGTQVKPVEVGEHVMEFKWKLLRTYRYNGCAFLCKFKTPEGLDWPWEWRGGGMAVVKESDTFYLEPEAENGLFDYGAAPSVKIGWGPKAAAGEKTAKVTVRDEAGKTVWEKSVAVDPARKSESLKLDGFSARGIFAVTVEVPDVGTDFCVFGTIPVFQRVKGRRTPFGATNIWDEEYARLAARLGFSFTRLFQTWKELEPMPGLWKLENLDKTIAANVDAGLKPWICLYSPPAWSLPEGMWTAGFEPSPFDLNAWSNALATLAKRYPGKLMGFEMLNEIVPGNKCKDPVRDYVEICKAGYKTLKAIDKSLVVQLAGGLWPHNYRIDCLNAGIGEWVDVLPVHYSTYDGIAEAKEDLSVRDIRKVRVADNETASGMSTWDMDSAAMLAKSMNQCHHVMTRWPDELCAGSLFITYFGGSCDSCGNWGYMIDSKTPRPVAVTLAVVQGKIGYAKPVGKFFVDGCPVQLFERDGKAIAFVAAPGQEGVAVKLPAKGAVQVTDCLGRESKAQGGTVLAGDMPVIAEGLDLDAMKLHAAARVGLSSIPAAEPQVVADASEKMAVPVLVRNPYADARTFTLSAGAAAWGGGSSETVELKPGEQKSVELFYAPNAGAKTAPVTRLAVTVATKGVPPVQKPFVLYAIDPASIGNLVKCGDFEDDAAKTWGGRHAVLDAPDGAGKALVLVGTGKRQYKNIGQNIELPVPGQSYLYTCWMRGEGQGGGSNLYEHFTDGKTKNYYTPAVFSMGEQGSKGWRFMVKRFDSQANTKALTVSPLADGDGKTWVDNVSLSLYRGTDFAAFAGRVGGEAKRSKIPLLCDNQVKQDGGYKWTPQNLAGIAELGWDKEGLILKCEVTDDVSAPKAIVSSTSPTGDEALKGDMLAVALFPKIGADGRPSSEQLRWYLSLANPGGGSGTTTLFRPAKYSMGLKAGQLAKDSSVYTVNFRRAGGKTVYDLKIPWSEIPGFSPAKGAMFGLNLVLIDADNGPGLGKMVWGADLGDAPSGCGIVTLLP